jgi:uncharacterized cofD-like protein
MINRYRVRKFFAPTAGFRPVIVLGLLGIASFSVGTALSFKLAIMPLFESIERYAKDILELFIPAESLAVATHFLGGGLLFLGLYLVWIAFQRGLQTVTGNEGSLFEDFVRRRTLAQGPRIVAIGGGTGLSTLLRGLKQHSSNITAVVTVTDDGGSSGKLIKEKGMIPPGDIRNCLVALADAEKSMTDLFQHRFKADSGALSGHNIGNLLIAALTDQAGGDFEKAIEKASEVLNIRGKVVPSSIAHVSLRAIMEDGQEICGETRIVDAARRIRRIFLEPEDVEAYKFAVDAILDADLICIGPGSVYTSVLPNLLVKGIADALAQTKAKKVYVCNVMTQSGESDRFTASEHVTAIQANLSQRLFDYVLVNTEAPSQQLLARYREQGQHWVEPDIDRIKAMGYKVVAGNFMSETDFVRHDPLKIAARAVALVER